MTDLGNLYKALNGPKTHMIKAERDIHFMTEALKEAKLAFDEGNVPIGAILVINDAIVYSARNQLYTNQNWASHAETLLIQANANAIRTAHKKGQNTELYTTLDPCIMCMGTACMNRIKRLIFGCPDPDAGTAHVPPITEYYKKLWPQITGPVLPEESHKLMIDFISMIISITNSRFSFSFN